MAIDRQRIINDTFNGKGITITGPTYPLSPSYDGTVTPWPFDPEAARRLLEEEGWFDRDGSGVISKIIDGKKVPFRFTLVYALSIPYQKPISEYIVSALKEVGIECNLSGLASTDWLEVYSNKTFDAIFSGWVFFVGPLAYPEQFRPIWHSEGSKEKSSQNIIGFANPEIDAIIEKLDYEYDPKKRLELYHRFHAIIHEEEPYTFLFMPTVTLAYRDYVHNIFVPIDRQDLIPGADVQEPDFSISWIKK